MKINLDPDNTKVLSNGKLDLRTGLIVGGVKAAVCYKQPDKETNMPISPEMIRATETEAKLISRGLTTILDDHGTPIEQYWVGLEILGIPKILCMLLNNEKFLAACERSLRYTPVEMNEFISKQEFELYTWWKESLTTILLKDYEGYFKKNFGEKGALKAAEKIAQENARNMVTLFMPTTLTYSVPLAQINKIAVYMQKLIDTPNCSELIEMLKPYMTDFIKQLEDLDVLVTNNKAQAFIYNEKIVDVADAKTVAKLREIPSDDNLLYKNNKNINLSLFAEYNKFSGINLQNNYGPSISYNTELSWGAFAQGQRHRTSEWEMLIPLEFKFFSPKILEPYKGLKNKWELDMLSVQNVYPQGQIIKANINTSLKSYVQFFEKERQCMNAQFEIYDTAGMQMILDVHNGLLASEQYSSLAEVTKPYIKVMRCQSGDYTCPNPCGRINNNRTF